MLFLLLLTCAAMAQEPGADAGQDWGSPVPEAGPEAPSADLEESEQIFLDHHYAPDLYPESLSGFMEGQAGTAPEADTAQLLREILSSEAFRDSAQPEVQNPTILQRINQWLNNTLSSIASMLGLSGQSGSVVLYILVVVALALVAVIIRQLIVSSGGRGRRAGPEGEIDEADPDLDLVRLAEEHAARGDYRLALRYRFLAVVRSLELPASTLTTNSMLVRRVRQDSPASAERFSQLVRLFEDSWYGSIGCDSQHYAQARSLAGQLLDSHARELEAG